MIKKRVRGNPIPLIIEKHPEDYNGYPFITLIQYKNEDLLVIVDNLYNKVIDAYVLDFCGPTGVNEESIIEVVYPWWNDRRSQFPVSIEFSRLGMTPIVSKIYRSYHIEYITRIIGPLPLFKMDQITKIRRRKRKPISPNIEIHNTMNSVD